MKYMKCKCGKCELWTSMGAYDCQGCADCKTTYAQHPKFHRELKPHTFIKKYNQNTGKPYKMCKVCGYIDDESYN